MNSIISSIFSTLKDYREEEQFGNITIQKISSWINQFPQRERMPILMELDNIFKKRYFSKKRIKKFLENTIDTLTNDLKFASTQDFLKNSTFLDLQADGKSQKVMLSLLDDILKDKYKISLEQCGSITKKYSIYIDDILCTGLTLITDLKKWSENYFLPGKTNKEAIADKSTNLILMYVFIHQKNYYKKKREMKFKISNEIANNHIMYMVLEIENETTESSKIDLILPIENNQSRSILEYKNSIIELVDNHTKQYKSVSPEEFFRPQNLPKKEEFFSSPSNRIILENSFLNMGIGILSNSQVTNKNIRALGYSIPSFKNFGFGALCFTWRNIPNNAPLVFWYSGGGFTPLFDVKRSSSQRLNFIESESNFDFNLDDD